MPTFASRRPVIPASSVDEAATRFASVHQSVIDMWLVGFGNAQTRFSQYGHAWDSAR